MMIILKEHKPFLIIWGNAYLIELITVELNGDIVRFKFDGEKILSRPYTVFKKSNGEIFNSSIDVKDYVDLITKYPNKYKIQSLADKGVSGKDHRSINYVTELIDGVRLHKSFEIDEVSGFLKATNYFKDFDGSILSDQVMRVEEEYEVDEDEPIMNAKNAKSRTKKRKYFKEDGSGVDEDIESIKTTQKFYTEKNQTRKEGYRRRHNVQLILEDRIGLVLMLTGQAANITEVYGILVSFLELHSGSINAWLESGRGNVFQEIESDVLSGWLDTVIPNTPQTQSNGLINSVGEKLRDFVINRLKGVK